MESKQEYERSYEDIPLGDAQMPVNDMDEDKTEKKRDYMTFLIMIQVIICIVLFMALFLMSKVGGDSFVSVKSEFDKIMSYDMGITGIKDVFQSAVKFVMAPSNQWKQEKDDNTEKTTSDIMQQKSGKIGMGGPVIDVSDGKAPTKTSFARYTITTAITPPIAQKDGEISSGFGYRNDPISGKWSFHAGLDIAADEGTRIAAAYNGTVKKTGTDDTAGNYILIEHNKGLITFYCHCSEIVAQEGDNIRAGETIARVGSTGYSTGPHLHFEIRINEIKYNPAQALHGVYT